ncbi:ATP-binding protein [Kitasatospora sp. NPDC057542]|uniref:ATP-binding protein n=1 Tax=Kitasatospora sp. NPDC057542 TaxID=3346162 RepID=UPI00367920E7
MTVLFNRTGRHGRATAHRENVRQATQAAEAAFTDTWLAKALQNTGDGLPMVPDGAPPAVKRAAELVRVFAARIHQQADENVVTAIQPVLAQLQRQEVLLSAAQRSVSDPDPMSRLYEADHANALALRYAVRLAVLAGGFWPEARRQPARLIEVGRAALGRVAEYQRVGFWGNPEITVRPEAIEPLAAALAELMDNALRHGGPQAEVVLECDADPGTGGAWLVVRDNGPGIPPATLMALRNVLAGDGRVPSGMSWPGHGMRLVAAAARRLGLQVAVASAPERTAATVLVPPTLLIPPNDPPADFLRIP